MANPIKKIKTLKGTVCWQVDGRRFNASPSRPQFPTKEQAETVLAEMIAKRGAGLHPTRRDVTFQMQADAYLKHAEHVGKLAGKTLRAVVSTLRVHLTPAFGKKRIGDINPATIRSFLVEKAAPKKDDGTPRLGRNTIRRMRMTLSVIMQSAVNDGLISANPVASAKLDSGSRAARVEASVAVPKERVFTAEQQADLLRWCAEMDAELGDYLNVMLKTGCRPGEARALRWGDIHADHVRIERNLDDRNVETGTKTGKKRTTDLTPALKKALAERKARRLAEGHGIAAADHVFGNGEPVTDREISRRFDAALEACKIAGHSRYDCRHTMASVLYNRCKDVVYCARQIGDKPETFLKYYAHFVADTSERYIDLLDE